MPPKKDKVAKRLSKDASDVSPGSPQRIKRNSSALLQRLRGTPKKERTSAGGSPGSSPTVVRKAGRRGKKSSGGGGGSVDATAGAEPTTDGTTMLNETSVTHDKSGSILIADERVFGAQMPDFDGLAISEEDMNRAMQQGLDGKTPEEIAEAFSLLAAAGSATEASSDDAGAAVLGDLVAEEDWESGHGDESAPDAPPRPPKTSSSLSSSSHDAIGTVGYTTESFAYIHTVDSAFPPPAPDPPEPHPTLAPFSYIDMIDAMSAAQTQPTAVG
eukprot:m.94336 g.94336  ORF g.94336 m.94336 type:complete len:272 (+) comp10044_c0_seq1:290-1105(+)